MSKMISIRYEKNGPAAGVLHPLEVERPEPGPGEVRLRLIASPIHNHDLIIVAGGYGTTPGLPASAGSEALGIVDKTGAGVTGLVPGQRVIAAGLSGTWSDYYLAPAEKLVLVPESLPDLLAAQIAGMPIDALIAFNEIGAAPGEWLIVNAANGAVGKAFTQIAKSRGIRVAGLVHREGARADLMALGYEDIFVTAENGWQEAAKARIGGARLAGGLDLVGGPVVAEMVSLFSADAKLLILGAMSGEGLTLNPGPLIFGELTVKGFWGGRAAGKLAPAALRGLIEELLALAAKGRFDLPVAGTFPLARITEAVNASGKARNGKVVMVP